jgi:methylmalonyl-CoA/ethylmalonyl-CoA epimerase
MTPKPLRHSTIGQISVNVHDLPKAIAFYRDVLGMDFLFEVPSMAFFKVGNVRLMLGLPEKPEFDHPASVIYYAVENIQQAHKDLSGNGVRFAAEPHLVARLPGHELWMAFFRDIDNNMLALMSEIPTS